MEEVVEVKMQMEMKIENKYDKTCIHCGSPFKTNRSKKIFCSEECKRRHDSNKMYHKKLKYSEEHKEANKKTCKQYYEKNKDSLKIRSKQYNLKKKLEKEKNAKSKD
jgi:hypothetical protein